MASTLDAIILYGKQFQERDVFQINPKLQKAFSKSIWATEPDPFISLTVIEFLQYGRIKCKADTEEFIVFDVEALRYLIGSDTKIRRKMSWIKTMDILPLPGVRVPFSDGVNEISTKEVQVTVGATAFDQRCFSVSLYNGGSQLSSFPYWMNSSFLPS